MACDIQSALLSREMGALHGLMTDPFIIAYWCSEGRIASATEVAAELDAYGLPADTGGLTFATDRAQFPPLAGIPPETMFGPDVNVSLVVYSEGWGENGQGAALIYVLQNVAGKPHWSHMVYAHTHFDG